MSAVSPDLIEALRVRLKAELEELDALLQQTAQDSAPVELDQQSVGGWRAWMRCGCRPWPRKRSVAAVSEVRVSRRPSGVSNKESLAICTRCGEAISEKRLKVDPTYLLCVNCAL